MTLSAAEFSRRFLLHVLPAGFHRIRSDGFLGNRHRTEKLARCRQLLGTGAPATPVSTSRADYRDRYEALTGRSSQPCPVCHDGHMRVIDQVTRTDGHSATIDSSGTAPHARHPDTATPPAASLDSSALTGGKHEATVAFYRPSASVSRPVDHRSSVSGSTATPIPTLIQSHSAAPGQRFRPRRFLCRTIISPVFVATSRRGATQKTLCLLRPSTEAPRHPPLLQPGTAQHR